MSVSDRTANWREDRKLRRLLHTAPTRALSEVEEGAFVRIVGVVKPLHDKVLVAPLSGRPCAYHSLEVRTHLRIMPTLGAEKVPPRGSTLGSESVFEEHAKIRFVLEASGISVVVDPANTLISSGFDHEAGVDDPRAQAALIYFGLVGSVDGSTFREAILGIGEPITVYGVGVRELRLGHQNGERSYRDDLEVPLVFAGREGSPLVIRDDLDSL